MKPLTESLGQQANLQASDAHIVVSISAPGGYADNRRIAVNGDVEALKELAAQAFAKAVGTIKRAAAELRDRDGGAA
jgi:hypothetical protein